MALLNNSRGKFQKMAAQSAAMQNLGGNTGMGAALTPGQMSTGQFSGLSVKPPDNAASAATTPLGASGQGQVAPSPNATGMATGTGSSRKAQADRGQQADVGPGTGLSGPIIDDGGGSTPVQPITPPATEPPVTPPPVNPPPNVTPVIPTPVKPVGPTPGPGNKPVIEPYKPYIPPQPLDPVDPGGGYVPGNKPVVPVSPNILPDVPDPMVNPNAKPEGWTNQQWELWQKYMKDGGMAESERQAKMDAAKKAMNDYREKLNRMQGMRGGSSALQTIGEGQAAYGYGQALGDIESEAYTRRMQQMNQAQQLAESTSAKEERSSDTWDKAAAVFSQNGYTLTAEGELYKDGQKVDPNDLDANLRSAYEQFRYETQLAKKSDTTNDTSAYGTAPKGMSQETYNAESKKFYETYGDESTIKVFPDGSIVGKDGNLKTYENMTAAEKAIVQKLMEGKGITQQDKGTWLASMVPDMLKAFDPNVAEWAGSPETRKILANVTEYVKKNGRSPTRLELAEMYHKAGAKTTLPGQEEHSKEYGMFGGESSDAQDRINKDDPWWNEPAFEVDPYGGARQGVKTAGKAA